MIRIGLISFLLGVFLFGGLATASTATAPLKIVPKEAAPDLAATVEEVLELTGAYLELLDQQDAKPKDLGELALEAAQIQLKSWQALYDNDNGKITLDDESFEAHLLILALTSAVTSGLGWTWFGDTPFARELQDRGAWKTATELGVGDIGNFLTEAGFVLFMNLMGEAPGKPAQPPVTPPK